MEKSKNTEKEASVSLQEGKLDSGLLRSLVFDKLKTRRPEVLARPGIGEDCAVLDFGPYECVLSTDPITAAVSEIGSLAVHISCNDIASNGLAPLGLMLAVMLPPGTTAEEIGIMMEQAAAAAEELGVEIIGGHTEITAAVRTPVIVSTAIARNPRPGAEKRPMAPGDDIFITKTAGLEGTGILASDYGDLLREILSEEELEEAGGFLKNVSVVAEGIAAGRVGFSGMHDITEGGVLGAVWELCQVSGLGAEIREEAVPVPRLTRAVCGFFEMDPLRLISSGSMLIVAPPENRAEMERAMAEADVPLARIGRMSGPGEAVFLWRDGRREPVAPPEADELYKAPAKRKKTPLKNPADD